MHATTNDRTRSRRLSCGLAVVLAALASVSNTSTADAQTCTRADFAAAVDRSGAQLRDYNVKAGPELVERMRRYAEAKKIPDDRAQDAALEAIQDAKLKELDEKSATLLLKVDSLGRVDDGASLDCAKLNEIKSASAVLLSVMREKSEYMQSRLDKLTADAVGKPLSPAPKPAERPREKLAAKPVDKAQNTAPPPAEKTPAPPTSSWSTEARPNDAYSPQSAGDQTASVAPEDGYSIDEIRDATRGFFGTISTNLASVIEYAFKTSGRPTAYVLGWEGGGAFLAGLRFGKGVLYLRHQQETREVYWHGPSLGTDLGASGSRTMFLIYKLHEPEALYRSFTGVDGSAYFVGGVGLTLLKGGDVVMAPIRSGLGFRLGASIGYVRFTNRPTWNPF